MILYLLKSGLCLALVLLVYKVLLERERMYIFNRYYLLFGLCFSLLVPFITFETIVEVPVTQNPDLLNFENMNASEAMQSETTIENTVPMWFYALAVFYSLGLFVFSLRFMKNIYHIFYKITKNVKVFYKKASLVLLKENVLPHTFLHYVFLEKESYDTQNIAEELYTHELAHVTQKHTLDIILIELIQILFWFNPILIYYKKAIQLNHEFLADDAVLKSNIQIPAYQHLLLENAHWNHNLHLASNLNFSVTKKRLQMMTKHTSRARTWLVATLTIPIFIGALFLFSTKVIAQEMTAEIIDIPATEKVSEKTQDPKETYYKNATFIFEDEQGNKVKKTYAQLTKEEKALLIPPPKKPIAKRPTSTLLNDWKNKKQFAIWIDDKVVNNDEISNYSIIHYNGSFVYKNARSKRFPQPYQMHLYTEAGFKSLKTDLASPLSKNAVLHFKGHKNAKHLGKKKVGTVSKEETAKNVRHELAKANQLPVHYVNEKNGPNEMELPSDKVIQKRPKDIELFINKNKQFLLNGDYVFKMNNLDKSVKSELSKISHKRSKTASIVYDAAVSKEFVSKTIAILKNNKIYDITTRVSNSKEEIRLPPPPPAAKKKKVVEGKYIPGVIKKGDNAVDIMHRIVRDQKLETMMIDGKKYYYVVKNGRKFIFNEKSQMVDKKGKPLPPPPPPPPAPKKIKVKETKVPAPKKVKTTKKGEKVAKKYMPKVRETSKKDKTPILIEVAETPTKSKRKAIVGRKAETMMINGKKHYYYIKNGQKFIYNNKHQLVDEKGKLIPPPPKPTKKKLGATEKSSEWKDVKYFLDKEKNIGTITTQGEKYYYIIEEKKTTVYNRFGEKMDETDKKFQSALSKVKK
ncbi:M56 family metallopeptidase [Kordia sp.]|uniref:M56 family metallopeptidase n=1 Tax=Kordia sp. TaxID=1965332 RepID=UPI003B5951E2